MDVDRDGDVDGVDTNFMALALAGKFRFPSPPVLTVTNCAVLRWYNRFIDVLVNCPVYFIGFVESCIWQILILVAWVS